MNLFFTIDAEEFSESLKHDQSLSEKDSVRVSIEGLKNAARFLDKERIKATFFFSAKLARNCPQLVRKIAKKHEIALHCLEHTDDYSKLPEKEVIERLSRAKKELEKISRKKIVGFRAPKMLAPSIKVLKKLGFSYDSSLHPTFVPGRYFKAFESRKVHKKGGIFIVPVSVSRFFRLPISWFWFRTFPKIYTDTATSLCFDLDCFNIYFHSWEFADLEKYSKKLPAKYLKNSGKKLEKMLKQYFKKLESNSYESKTIMSCLEGFEK